MSRLRRRLTLAALLAALAIVAIPLFAATERARQPAVAPADTTLQDPEALVRSVYRLVSFGPGERTDWAPVRALFLPQAVVVLRTSRTATSVFSVDGFIDDFVRFDSIPAVARGGFRESVVRLRATVYRDIAHVLVLYEAEVLGGARPPQRGIDSWELVRRDGRWWIAAITNEVVTPDLPVPAEITP